MSSIEPDSAFTLTRMECLRYQQTLLCHDLVWAYPKMEEAFREWQVAKPFASTVRIREKIDGFRKQIPVQSALSREEFERICFVYVEKFDSMLSAKFWEGSKADVSIAATRAEIYVIGKALLGAKVHETTPQQTATICDKVVSALEDHPSAILSLSPTKTWPQCVGLFNALSSMYDVDSKSEDSEDSEGPKDSQPVLERSNPFQTKIASARSGLNSLHQQSKDSRTESMWLTYENCRNLDGRVREFKVSSFFNKPDEVEEELQTAFQFQPRPQILNIIEEVFEDFCSKCDMLRHLQMMKILDNDSEDATLRFKAYTSRVFFFLLGESELPRDISERDVLDLCDIHFSAHSTTRFRQRGNAFIFRNPSLGSGSTAHGDNNQRASSTTQHRAESLLKCLKEEDFPRLVKSHLIELKSYEKNVAEVLQPYLGTHAHMHRVSLDCDRIADILMTRKMQYPNSYLFPSNEKFKIIVDRFFHRYRRYHPTENTGNVKKQQVCDLVKACAKYKSLRHSVLSIPDNESICKSSR